MLSGVGKRNIENKWVNVVVLFIPLYNDLPGGENQKQVKVGLIQNTPESYQWRCCGVFFVPEVFGRLS